MRHVPEPDRSEWIARMRERARLDADELVPRPRFDVFGLAEPQLRPAALAEAGRVNEVWDSVGLAYGDWAASAGPWVMVTTVSRRGDAPDGGVEAEHGLAARRRTRRAVARGSGSTWCRSSQPLAAHPRDRERPCCAGCEKGSEAVSPVAIVWLCLTAVDVYAAAGRDLGFPRPDCRSCAGPLVFWTGYRRYVREAGRH